MSPKTQAIVDAFGEADSLLSSELRNRCAMKGAQFHTGMNQLRNQGRLDSCRIPGGEVRYWLVRRA